MGWRAAFLLQAAADYELFKRLSAQADAASCHRLHLLQMATEKLAKGLMASETEPPPRVHAAFLDLIRTSQANARLRKACRMSRAQFREHLISLYPIARQIEALAPTGQRLGQPNPEYPWQAGDRVIAPIEHDFELGSGQHPLWLRMLRLIDWLFILARQELTDATP